MLCGGIYKVVGKALCGLNEDGGPCINGGGVAGNIRMTLFLWSLPHTFDCTFD